MDLVDESGEIRATAFKNECDKYYEMIEIGKVYYITQGTLKAANKQYSNLNNDYELTFRDRWVKLYVEICNVRPWNRAYRQNFNWNLRLG